LYSVVRARLTLHSSSDIQKKLRELLPSDYAKDFRQYRPENGVSSTARLNRLQQHRQARKLRAVRLEKAKQTSSFTHAEHTLPSADSYQDFEGPLSAFRNYGGSCSAPTKPTQLSLSADPSESQLIIPSLLLLDGSSVTNTALNLRQAFQDNTNQSSKDHSISTSSMEQLQDPTPQSTEMSIDSIQSLQARLSRRSSSVVQHVQSVLRYSLSNSWRSSVSWRSSWISFGSQISMVSAARSIATKSDIDEDDLPPTSSTQAPAEGVIIRTSQNQLSRTPNVMTSEQEGRWVLFWPGHYLIDYVMAFELSPCRKMKHTAMAVCDCCGLTPTHLSVATPDYSTDHAFSNAVSFKRFDRMPPSSAKDVNRKDYLNNSPLHFAASARGCDPKVLITLINMGADIHAVNTWGATFLHVLFFRLPRERLSSFIPLLEHLGHVGFRFSRRDYSGRQPFHHLLHKAHYQERGAFEEAMTIARPDLDAMDSSGLSIRKYLRKNPPKGRKSKARAEAHLSAVPISGNAAVEFKTKISEMDDDWVGWLDWLAMNDRSLWIDRHGDTALLALLKHWKSRSTKVFLEDIVTKMMKLGVEIQMRDRYGDTALAVAARRGLRPVVKVLVEEGASIHTVNLRDMSILSCAQKSMSRAKADGDDKLSAMIWSCIIYLLDLKACEFPTLPRQHWAAWAPDSKFMWDEGKEETSKDISQVLSDSGFAQGILV
jgi:Ankyrin repeat